MKAHIIRIVVGIICCAAASIQAATADTWHATIHKAVQSAANTFTMGHGSPTHGLVKKIDQATSIAIINKLIKEIIGAHATDKRNFYLWFGSQQDIIADRFIAETAEPYSYTAGSVTYTFNVDVPASKEAWANATFEQKSDGSPALMLTITAMDKNSGEKELFAPLLIKRSRDNYSIAQPKTNL
jgi:hypothetical protein